MLLGDAGQSLVVGLFVAHHGAVGFDNDGVVVGVVDDFSLLKPRVKLVYVSNCWEQDRMGWGNTSIWFT